MPTINFSIDETTSANAQAAATALRSLTKEYQKLNRVIVQTEKQLLKFDEINRPPHRCRNGPPEGLGVKNRAGFPALRKV